MNVNLMHAVIYCVLLLFTTVTHGQSIVTNIVFPAGTTTNWTISVPTNHSIRLNYHCNGWSIKLKRDSTEAPLPTSTYAKVNPIYQGPIDVVVSVASSSSPAFFAFHQVPSTGLTTKLYQGTESIEVAVPAGKVLKILDATTGTGDYFFGLKTETGTAITSYMAAYAATINSVFYPGPITFSVYGGASGTPKSQYITYYFLDGVSLLPDGAMQTSAASSVVIEKSADLSNWTPAGLIQPQSSPQSFYRIKASQ